MSVSLWQTPEKRGRSQMHNRTIVLFLAVMVLAQQAYSLSSCSVLNAPGTYVLTSDLSNAPYDASGVMPGDTACIVIASSDVVLDCNGHTLNNTLNAANVMGIITNVTSPGTYSNVTIQNCNLVYYDYNVYLSGVGQGSVLNTNVSGMRYDAFAAYNDQYVNFTNDNVIANTLDFSGVGIKKGFDLGDSSGLMVTGDSVYSPPGTRTGTPYYLYDTNSSNLSDDVSYGASGFGFYVEGGSTGNVISDDDINDSAFTAYSVDFGSSNLFADDNASDINYSAFSVSGFDDSITYSLSEFNNFTDNAISGNPNMYAAFMAESDAPYNTFSYDNATGNGNYGFYLQSGNDSMLEGNIAGNNPIDGFHLDTSANNTLSDNTAYGNSNHGFYLTSSANNTFINNTAYSNSHDGFHVDSGSDNNILANNTAYSNGWAGFIVMIMSTGNIIANNTVHDTGNMGIWLLSAANNTVVGNTAYDNGNTGFFIQGSSGDIIANNTANNDGDGFHFDTNSNETFANNTIYSNGGYGVYLASNSNSTFTGNTAYSNSRDGFRFDSGSDDNIISDNLAYSNGWAGIIVMSASDGNLIANNTVHNTGNIGIWLLSASNNTVTGNTAHDNGNTGFQSQGSSGDIIANNTANYDGEGFYFDTSSDEVVANNTAYGNSNGYHLSSSSSNNFTGNIVHDDGNTGFLLQSSSDNNNIINNTAYSNSFDGFYSNSVNGNIYLDNTAYGNGNGIFLDSNSNNNSYINNTIHNNSNDGLLIHSSDQNLIQGQHSFNDTNDIYVVDDSGSPITINLTGMIFDNPSGDMNSYTTLSLNDTLNNGESYYISWTSNPSPTPEPPFAQKFVKIQTASGSPSMDSVVWSWTDTEAIGYNPSTFELWKYSGSWDLLNSTPDTVGDTLSITGLNPQSVYSILGAGPVVLQAEFVPPTPDNGSITSDPSILVNISINEATYPLGNFTYDWNGTDYAPYDPSLMLMYNFDNISSLGEDNSHVTDLSLYGNNATCSGTCPTWTPYGKYDGAFTFDGSDYLSIPDSPSLDPTDALTISFWMNSNSLSGTPSIISKASTPGWGGSYATYNVRLSNNQIQFWTNDFSRQLTSTGTLTPGVWQLVTCTYDGANETIYIDGNLDSVLPETGSITSSPYALAIGDHNAISPGEFYTGSLDEVRIYNRSLSASEVYDLYVSNLNKYDTGKWDFITNQSFGSFPIGDYNFTYFGCAVDGADNMSCTDERLITDRVLPSLPPQIAFAPPTPDDGVITTYPSFLVNISINETVDPLGKAIFDWNGTNSTLDISGLVLMYNFDNVSVLGEDNYHMTDLTPTATTPRAATLTAPRGLRTADI